MNKIIKTINSDFILIVCMLIAVYINTITIVLSVEAFNETTVYAKEATTERMSIYERKAKLGDIDIYEIEVALLGFACLVVMSNETQAYVVDFHFIDVDGEKRAPAKEAGLAIYDEILKIDGFDATVDNSWEIIRRGETTTVTVLRNEEVLGFLIEPVYNSDVGRYQIGVALNHNRACFENNSLGMLSFFNPANGAFAAFGHAVRGVRMEQHGNRGYILGPQHVVGIYNNRFRLVAGNHQEIGYVLDNKDYGAYGILHNFYLPPGTKLYRIARPGEVYNGPAKMLVTINGKEPQWIDVEISGIGRNYNGWLTITTPSGSPIQFAGGMSGAVVVQNDKIAGIVARGIVELGAMFAEPPERMMVEFLLFQQEWERVLKGDAVNGN